jgi:hypothetical protein
MEQLKTPLARDKGPTVAVFACRFTPVRDETP